jgi:hypothetical protein
VNTGGLRRLIPKLNADQIRELPEQVRQKVHELISEQGALHDAEEAAFQGNLTPRSLALTIFNAARDAMAARKGAAFAQGTLTSDELSAALKLAGLQTASESPLPALLPTGEREAESRVSALVEKGVLDASGDLTQSWRDALGVLAAPAHWVHLTAGDADEVQTVQYYFGRAGTVAHIINEEHHEIAFPVTIDGSLEEAGKWMGWKLFPHAEPFSADLGCDELSALAATTDAMREEQMRAALERRRPDPSHTFTMPRLLTAIDSGSQQQDGRWMTAMINAHAPESFAATGERAMAGVTALSNRSWMAVKDEEVSLHPPLVGIGLELGGSTPYLVVGIGSGSEPGTFLLAVRGLTGFWVFRFGVPVPDEIRFSRLGGKTLETLVNHHLEAVLHHPKQPEAAPVQLGPAICASCHQPLRPQAKFCSKCGAPAGPVVSGT